MSDYKPGDKVRIVAISEDDAYHDKPWVGTVWTVDWLYPLPNHPWSHGSLSSQEYGDVHFYEVQIEPYTGGFPAKPTPGETYIGPLPDEWKHGGILRGRWSLPGYHEAPCSDTIRGSEAGVRYTYHGPTLADATSLRSLVDALEGHLRAAGEVLAEIKGLEV